MAETDDGEIMAVSHVNYPVYGLQFHPEQHLRCSNFFLPIFNELVQKAKAPLPFNVQVASIN